MRETAVDTKPPQPAPTDPPPFGGAFFPVPVDALESPELALDLYLIHDGHEPVLYRSVGSPYSLGDSATLAAQGVRSLFVPTRQHRVFQKAMVDRLERAYADPALTPAERSRVVRACCAKMIEDLMALPQIPGIARTIGDMAARFAAWCVEDEEKFGHLLDLSDHDFHTAAHMVNVGVGCGLLCFEMFGAEGACLRDAVQGGLLHDVGKRGIPAPVLAKEGKLTEEEWALIRAHPQAGVELLASQKGVSPAAIEMARDHHERLDGRGYPNGLKASQIGRLARVCAVVDVFDALSAGRPARPALPPGRVLDGMREEAGTVIDRAAFEAWERVVLRAVQRDPGRCVKDGAGVATPRLRAMIPSAPKQAVVRHDADEAVAAGPEQHCDIPVTVTGRDGAEIAGRIVVISARGGMRLVLDAPAPTGDTLRLRIDGRPTLAAAVKSRRYGPAGEPILECEITTGRRAS